MPAALIDVDAYLARIGHSDARDATLTVLRNLHWRHVSSIPFENLDVAIGRTIDLDPAALQRKIVANRRGGYCFESNALFMYALRGLGFRVTALAARVLWEREDPSLPGRGHMVLQVDLPEGPYLADVGFGAQTARQPLKLEVGVEQSAAVERYRLIDDFKATPPEFDLQAQVAGNWRTLYRFSLLPQLPVDFEAPNWFQSTHPSSFFANNLVAAIPTADRRYTLHNAEFRTAFPGGKVETRMLRGPDELVEVLERYFSLKLAAEDRAALPGLFAKWAADSGAVVSGDTRISQADRRKSRGERRIEKRGAERRKGKRRD
jgi:N-hydroxyarylamine O-acetyltransferase